jgi:hypothetical protein
MIVYGIFGTATVQPWAVKEISSSENMKEIKD